MTERPTKQTRARQGQLERYETDVVLRNGSTVRVRAIRPKDVDGLTAFLVGLSNDSRALRYQGGMSEDAVRRLAAAHAEVDDGQFGIVATVGPDGTIVGHAMYAMARPDQAEVALTIADQYQGLGLGTILLGQIATVAADRGVRTFEARVLPENHAMLSLFRDSGFELETHVEPGEIRVVFATELTPAAQELFEERDWNAAVNAVRTFLEPRSVAVIGASRCRGTISAEVFHNLLEYEFRGPVLPVNAAAGVVQSVVAYPTIEDVPGEVDLAVIVVPMVHVQTVVEGCARKGVRALVIISAGFAETGKTGRERQARLMRTCRDAGMRVIGPNCMGILNTDPAVRLNATFAPTPPPRGRVAFMSQSGALGLAVMDYAATLGLGLSSFASVGNKADISGNDLIRYWEQDPNTDVILLYLESFGNPRRFSRIARRVGRTKPIIAVKSGRSRAGARATGSHTGALIAASDVNVEALFRQAGVIRTDTLEQMFDAALLLACQTPPSGRRVAILSNAGGPAILCADTCEAEGLAVPELGEATRRALRAFLPEQASTGNPVDMIASATAEQYGEAIRAIASDSGVDAIIVIFIPPLATRADDVARALVDSARDIVAAKPILTVFMQSRGVPEPLRTAHVRLPSFTYPEDAALALARVARYGEWLARPIESPARFADVRADEAAAVVAAALGQGIEWLEPDAVDDLLRCWGLPVLDQRVVCVGDDVAAVARELGGRVAVKAIAPGLVHKTEAGAVQLGLDPAGAAEAAATMRTRLERQGHAPDAFLVQRMARTGTEMIVGVVHDHRFGPVVACGAGGTLVELLRDVTVRLTPLSARDAAEMVRELRSYPLLTGYRGSPPGDVASLEDIILRVAAMVEALPNIAELDLNPVIVHENGATIVDARVKLAQAEPDPLPGTRPSSST